MIVVMMMIYMHVRTISQGQYKRLIIKQGLLPQEGMER